MTIQMYPTDRIEYHRSVSILKKHLDAKTLTGSWAEGQAMTLEQAVDFALERPNA
jgi:hypothetical protein